MKAWFSKAIAKLNAFFALLLGHVAWTPPRWLQFLKDKACQGWKAARAKPKHSVGYAGLALVVLVGGFFGYRWYQSRPQPVVISFEAFNPDATPLKEDAKPDPFRVVFDSSVAPLDAIGKRVTEGITSHPELAGKWKWEDEKTLTFTPTRDWPVAQEYEVVLDPGLFRKSIRLETYELEFTTAHFVADVDRADFYQDPTDPNLKKTVISLSFSHPVDVAGFEKSILLQLRKKDLGFNVIYDKFRGEAHVHSEALPIPEKDSYVVATFAPTFHAAAGGNTLDKALKSKVLVPGKYTNFKIVSASATHVRNQQNEPERIIVVRGTVGMRVKDLAKSIQAYVLPRYHPKDMTKPNKRPFQWSRLGHVPNNILSQATKLPLEPIESEREYSTMHTFRHEAEAGQFVYVRVNKGIPGFGGYQLGTPFQRVLAILALPKELQIVGKGSILSLAGDRKVSVFSRDVEALKYEVGRIIPTYLSHLITQTGGKFTNPYFVSAYRFNEENLTEHFEQVEKLPALEEGKGFYSSFDFADYLKPGKRGLFFFSVAAYDLKRKRTGMRQERFVLVTDLGLLAKQSVNGERDLFVLSISSGRPVSGARVEVLGKNGLPVASAVTDSQGRCTFGDLTKLKDEKYPTVYVVKHGEDYSFLPFSRQDLLQNVSRFDVGGVTESSRGDQLRAYMFSDRGIYRPGEEATLGLIVKALQWSRSLQGLPIQVRVNDPRGMSIKKWNIQLSEHAFEELTFKTYPTSLTGSYSFQVHIVQDGKPRDLIGSTSIRVEEFPPDKLRITAHLSKEKTKGWVTSDSLTASVSLQNLFGTPATDRKIKASIQLSPAAFHFSAYRDFTFHDPLKEGKYLVEELPEARTDDQGETEHVLPIDKFDHATFRLTFVAEGFEAKGGRSVVTSKSVLVSPLNYVIGYKSEADLSYVPKDSDLSVELVALDSNVKPTEAKGLKVHLIEVKYVSALTETGRGTFEYVSVRKENQIAEQAFDLPRRKFLKLNTSKPGTFILVFRNDKKKDLSQIQYSVTGPADLSRALEKHAELKIVTNKRDYDPGEMIELAITAPYTGAGLITIERDRIYAHKWFKSTQTSSVQTIRIPANLEGNAYVNVSFVRDLTSEEIFMSPLSYGVVPFSINKKARQTEITLESPDLVKPGQTYRINYKTDKPSKIAIFAVDEGILQVAHYQNPDPLAFFLQKRALQVKTWQILSLILPEYQLVKKHSRSGGGYAPEAMAAVAKNLNPFRRKGKPPVAFWSGLLDAGTTTKTYEFTVPDYFNGTLRILAVAVARTKVGAFDRSAIVRGDLIISPNLPLFVAPGDEFVATVMVANNIEGENPPQDVKLALTASEHVEVLGNPVREMKISAMKEGTAEFHLKAKNILGSSRLRFVASAADKQAALAEELSVRPVNPYQSVVVAGMLMDGTRTLPITRKMYPEFRKLEAKVSHLPLAMLGGTVRYLESFPYQCTEQLTSKAFPALMLMRIPQWKHSREKTDRSVLEAINTLQTRQNSEGGFGFWSANSSVETFASIYALHFLQEAEDKGYPVADIVLKRGRQYLVEVLRNQDTSLHTLRYRAYALYLLTRMGVVTTRYLNTFLADLKASDRKIWKNDAIAIYIAMVHQLLKQDRLAQRQIKRVDLREYQTADYRHFYTSLMRDALYLYALATYFPDRLDDFDFTKLERMTKSLEKNFNTYSAAHFALAIGAYAKYVRKESVRNFSLAEVVNKAEQVLALPGGMMAHINFSANASSLVVKNSGDFPAYFSMLLAGFDLALPAAPEHQNIEVQRIYTVGGKPLTSSIKVGDDIEVRVRIRSQGDQRWHPNIAVVDLLPGGFDPDIESIREGSCGTASGINSFESSHVDIREDRILVFGSVHPEAAEYCYLMKAVNEGKFQTSPAYAHSMYDPATWSKAAGGHIDVSK